MARIVAALLFLTVACSKAQTDVDSFDAGLVPSISGITPARANAGSVLDVLVSGFDTGWNDSTTVSFGPGVTVGSVRAASPTALVVHIAVSAAAAAGPRDVTATDGAATEVLTGVFTIQPAVDAGPGLTPSVSGIVPTRAFLGRSLRVLVSGFDTSWTGSTAVSFGAGVTVNSVSAASPTALLADVTVSETAQSGPRDVTVLDGAATEVLAGAFSIASPVTVQAQGTLAQGSILLLTVQNHDFDNPFDDTSPPPGPAPPTYPNISMTAPAGIRVSVSNVTPFLLRATATVDLDAAPGPIDLKIVSGAATQTRFAAPGALALAARSAIPLAIGTPASGTVAAPYASALYSLTLDASLRATDVSAHSVTSGVTPSLAVLPKSGKFSDAITVAPAPLLITATVDPYYFVLWDKSGASGYNFTIDSASAALSSGVEAEPNDDPGHATALPALPAFIAGATLSRAGDTDFYKFTAAAGDAGKRVQVVTLAGDPRTCTQVDVFASDGVTSLGGPMDDFYQENFTSTPISAGTIYVMVSAGTFVAWTSSQTHYNLLVRLVAP